MELLIDPEWFATLPQWGLILIGTIALITILKGADLLVEGASSLARQLGIPEVIVGATIVSLGTTAPEAAVSVLAAWGDKPGLALGNAVGSVIADTALIFGFCCLLTQLPAERSLLNRQGWLQLLSGILLAVLCYGTLWLSPEDPSLGRGSGILLLGLLILYMWASVRWGRKARSTNQEEQEEGSGSTLLDSLRFLVGLSLVLVFGHVLISCVEELALRWGISQLVIASTIVAFGTSLPELLVSITAIKRGHVGLLIGNIIGADILNVLFVVGASAAASDLPLTNPGSPNPQLFLQVHLPAMLTVLLVFRLFIFSAIRKGAFQRWQGIPLLMLYLGYIAINAIWSS